MAQEPTSAFRLSLAGGIVTLIVALVSINSWHSMYEMSGMTFSYTFLVSMATVGAGWALVLFITGAACGLSIVIGAFMQRSGKVRVVRAGSILVVAASVVGIPGTFFGMILGGALSVAGAARGLSWKPPDASIAEAAAKQT